MHFSALIWIETGFVLTTIIFYYFFIRELFTGLSKSSLDPSSQHRIFKKILIGIGAWVIFVTVWALSGMMSKFSVFPLNMLPVLAIPLIAFLVAVGSKTGAQILRNIPPHRIISLQSFRVLVELLLWALLLDGWLPSQMTFEGNNFDILAGLTAPIVAYLVAKKRFSKSGILVWNIISLGLLINILSIALLSMPSPLRVFENEPSGVILTTFPLSWLPGLLVPLAYGLHFCSIRQLFIAKSDRPMAIKS